MKKEIAEVLLIGLRARREAARRYVYNTKMQLECELLDAEIRALENFITDETIKSGG